jgi:bifunctional DNA-binding transcriptional regulator/antitoxin component of YhaV-PrlF toxin-antitoxin module
MLKVKVSSKRQVTFPRRVCESLGIVPGDELILDHQSGSDQEVWTLRPATSSRRPWLGRLSAYAEGKPHDMASIRQSVEAGRKATRQ